MTDTVAEAGPVGDDEASSWGVVQLESVLIATATARVAAATEAMAFAIRTRALLGLLATHDTVGASAGRADAVAITGLTFGVGKRRAETMLAQAEVLGRLPDRVLQALHLGVLGVPQAQVLADELALAASAQSALVDAICAELLPDELLAARTCDPQRLLADTALAADVPTALVPADLRSWVRRRLIASDPDTVARKRQRSEREQTGVRSHVLPDGLGMITLTGPLDAIHRTMTALDVLIPPQIGRRGPDACPDGDDDPRTRGQWLFDTATGAILTAAQASGLANPGLELQLLLPAAPGLGPSGLTVSGPAGSGPAGSEPSAPARGTKSVDPIPVQLDPAALAAVISALRSLDDVDPSPPPDAGRPVPRPRDPLPPGSVPELGRHGPVDPTLIARLWQQTRQHDPDGPTGPASPVRLRRLVTRNGQVIAADDRAVDVGAAAPRMASPAPQPPEPTRQHDPSAAIRRVVVLRDRTCRFPGCQLPSEKADLDHLIPYGQGGATSTANLHALCRSHHRLKHDGWAVRHHPDGSSTWTAPDGARHHQPSR